MMNMLLWAACNTRSIFEQSKTGLSSEFYFSLTFAIWRQSSYLPITEERMNMINMCNTMHVQWLLAIPFLAWQKTSQ